LKASIDGENIRNGAYLLSIRSLFPALAPPPLSWLPQLPKADPQGGQTEPLPQGHGRPEVYKDYREHHEQHDDSQEGSMRFRALTSFTMPA
jgi:hypothetical protein